MKPLQSSASPSIAAAHLTKLSGLILHLVHSPPMRDFVGEEERQARDAAEGGYVTVDAEIRAARQDPAPEYTPAP